MSASISGSLWRIQGSALRLALTTFGRPDLWAGLRTNGRPSAAVSSNTAHRTLPMEHELLTSNQTNIVTHPSKGRLEHLLCSGLANEFDGNMLIPKLHNTVTTGFSSHKLEWYEYLEIVGG